MAEAEGRVMRGLLRAALGQDSNLTTREWKVLVAVALITNGQKALALDVEDVARLAFNSQGEPLDWQRKKTAEALRSLDRRGLIRWSSQQGRPRFTHYGPRAAIAIPTTEGSHAP